MAAFSKGDLVSVFGAEATDEAVKLKNDKRDEVSGFEPKLQPAKKVSRYRAGQVPAFMATSTPEVPLASAIQQANSAAQSSLAAAAPAVEAYQSDDEAVEAYDSDADAAVKHFAVPTPPDSDSDSEAEAEALAAARSRARARANAAAEQSIKADKLDSHSLVEQALLQPVSAPAVTVVHRGTAGGDSDSDASVHRPTNGTATTPSAGSIHRSDSNTASGSESDTESSSESEGDAGDWLLQARPVFVPAAARTTIKTQQQLDAEATSQAAEAEKQRAARREAAQEAMATVVQAEEDAAAAAGSDAEDMPSDGDHDSEEEADFAAWKLRELKRMQRDLKAQAAAEEELASTLARRAMTDAQRAEDDRRLEAAGLKVFTKEKRGRGFMQKHYHKGVFYMDEDSLKDKNDVRLRVDADAATGADKVDKKILPKAMQVRDFGKKSQSKWTHLAAEDTTFAAKSGYRADAVSSDLSSAPAKAQDEQRGAAGMWFKGGAGVVDRVISRMAGGGSDISVAGRVRRGGAPADASRCADSDSYRRYDRADARRTASYRRSSSGARANFGTGVADQQQDSRRRDRPRHEEDAGQHQHKHRYDDRDRRGSSSRSGYHEARDSRARRSRSPADAAGGHDSRAPSSSEVRSSRWGQ